jgi:Zn-dependent protease
MFMKIKAGLIAVFVKLGAKIVPTLAKLLKGLKFGKVAMAGASMAAYSYMFTWKFALIILGSLFVHEFGHLWAMRRLGMKTKGLYFIPFLGAAAVPDEDFPSRNAEAFIAIMGPIWGLCLALAMVIVYFVTADPFFAAVAGWMAFLNIFNLLPINPLDGGRIFKSVACSMSSRFGKIFLVVGMVAAAGLAFFWNFWIFTLLFVFGIFELSSEMRSKKDFPVMSGKTMAGALIGYAGLAGILLAIMFYFQSIPGADAALKILQE